MPTLRITNGQITASVNLKHETCCKSTIRPQLSTSECTWNSAVYVQLHNLSFFLTTEQTLRPCSPPSSQIHFHNYTSMGGEEDAAVNRRVNIEFSCGRHGHRAFDMMCRKEQVLRPEHLLQLHPHKNWNSQMFIYKIAMIHILYFSTSFYFLLNMQDVQSPVLLNCIHSWCFH